MMNLKGKKALVTGGAGFIGSELVHQLAEAGAHVKVIDNLANGRRENLADLSPEAVELTVADIRDGETMADLMRDTDLVFHLACLGVRHSIHSPEENHEVNATATLKALILAKESGVKRFIYVSSSEVYGTAQSVPMNENHPTFPRTPYGASKLAGECYARSFYHIYDFPVVVVRPFNTYGPRSHHEGDSGEVIPKFMLRALSSRPMIIFGSGDRSRDFTYVSDTAKGILLAACHDEAVGETFNLGTGREISIQNLAREIAEVVGNLETSITEESPRPGDVFRHCSDNSKARRLLGYAPNVSLHQGLTRLKDWYLGLGKPIEQLLEGEIPINWKKKEVHIPPSF